MKYSKCKLKYMVEEDFKIQTPVKPKQTIETWYCKLETNGMLTVKKGFGNDGSSGPTFDTESTKQPCTEHDIFYKLLQNKLLDLSWRSIIDIFLHKRLIQEGMLKCRANKWFKVLQIAGEKAATNLTKIYITKKHYFYKNGILEMVQNKKK